MNASATYLASMGEMSCKYPMLSLKASTGFTLASSIANLCSFLMTKAWHTYSAACLAIEKWPNLKENSAKYPAS
jgi:hypothetical protein